MNKTKSILCLCAVLAHSAHAIVVSGTNIVLEDGSNFGADYALTVYQDSSATDPTSIFFNVTNSTLSIVTFNIDEGSDWFLTSLNDEFSESTVANGDFPVLIQQTPSFQSNDQDAGFGDFYLGVNTEKDDGTGFSQRNIYGWAQLRNVGGNLTLLDSAVTYQGDGIIIGTTQVVPEPSTYAMLVGAMALFVAFRRRRK